MIHLGTSGYVYAHWRGIFYPEGLAARQWLAHYAQIFRTVELNATFYRLPTAKTVDGWREGTPPGFLFAVKGSRYLTHMKRLKDAGEGIERYFDLISRLGKKLSVVLWQLPPQMNRADPDRLARFLEALPRGIHALALEAVARAVFRRVAEGRGQRRRRQVAMQQVAQALA